VSSRERADHVDGEGQGPLARDTDGFDILLDFPTRPGSPQQLFGLKPDVLDIPSISLAAICCAGPCRQPFLTFP